MDNCRHWHCGTVLPGFAVVLPWGMDCLYSLFIMIWGFIKFKVIRLEDKSENVAWG